MAIAAGHEDPHMLEKVHKNGKQYGQIQNIPPQLPELLGKGSFSDVNTKVVNQERRLCRDVACSTTWIPVTWLRPKCFQIAPEVIWPFRGGLEPILSPGVGFS
jgi:hypothetical protein